MREPASILRIQSRPAFSPPQSEKNENRQPEIVINPPEPLSQYILLETEEFITSIAAAEILLLGDLWECKHAGPQADLVGHVDHSCSQQPGM